MHKEFLQSTDYLRHFEEFPEQTIGLTLFKRAKCHCIKWDKFRKCADTMEVQINEYLKAMIRMITVKKEQCNCKKHADLELWLKTIRSIESFLRSFLCPPTKHEEIPRTSTNLFTEEKKKAVQESNCILMNQKIQKCSEDEKYKLEFKVPKNANKKAVVESAHLTLFNKTSCGVDTGIQCQECSIQNLQCADCSLENNDKKVISFKRYEREIKNKYAMQMEH
jgi:hypothetical protein